MVVLLYIRRKTTYVVRIVQLSSDVCSSDLLARRSRIVGGVHGVPTLDRLSSGNNGAGDRTDRTRDTALFRDTLEHLDIGVVEPQRRKEIGTEACREGVGKCV